MFVDASAICAILLDEADAALHVGKLETASDRRTSPIAVFEAVLAVSKATGGNMVLARARVSDFLRLADIAILPIAAEELEIALDAFDRFGKGRHPAGLNLGGCFAYACAKTHRLPLLFKGDDFAQTDVWAA